MKWQTLDKQQTEKTLAAVRSSGMGSLFSLSTTEVKQTPLPFYRNVMLYRITNFATLPAFSLYYLGNGDYYHYLDGSVDVIEHYNKPEILMLNPQTVMPYLDFYFRNIVLEIGEVSIPGDRDNDAALISFPEDADVTLDETSRHLVITTPLYFDGSIVSATIEVSLEGHVRIIDTKMSIQGLSDIENANLDYDKDSSYY